MESGPECSAILWRNKEALNKRFRRILIASAFKPPFGLYEWASMCQHVHMLIIQINHMASYLCEITVYGYVVMYGCVCV